MMIAKRSLGVVIAMMLLCGIWLIVAPFAASADQTRAVWCPWPPEAMKGGRITFPADGSGPLPFERAPCEAPARNRINAGLMLIAASVLGGILTMLVFDEDRAVERQVGVRPVARTGP